MLLIIVKKKKKNLSHGCNHQTKIFNFLILLQGRESILNFKLKPNIRNILITSQRTNLRCLAEDEKMHF